MTNIVPRMKHWLLYDSTADISKYLYNIFCLSSISILIILLIIGMEKKKIEYPPSSSNINTNTNDETPWLNEIRYNTIQVKYPILIYLI